MNINQKVDVVVFVLKMFHQLLETHRLGANLEKINQYQTHQSLRPD